MSYSIRSGSKRRSDQARTRTDKNYRGQGDHQPTMIEIAAQVLLREALNLDDGDEVEIDLPAQEVEAK